MLPIYWNMEYYCMLSTDLRPGSLLVSALFSLFMDEPITLLHISPLRKAEKENKLKFRLFLYLIRLFIGAYFFIFSKGQNILFIFP